MKRKKQKDYKKYLSYALFGTTAVLAGITIICEPAAAGRIFDPAVWCVTLFNLGVMMKRPAI